MQELISKNNQDAGITIKLPAPRELSPREEVIQILAEGLWDLVISGRRPDRRRASFAPIGTASKDSR